MNTSQRRRMLAVALGCAAWMLAACGGIDLSAEPVRATDGVAGASGASPTTSPARGGAAGSGGSVPEAASPVPPSSNTGAGGGCAPTTPPDRSVACSAAAGHLIPYATACALAQLIAGDWLRCDGQGYPAQYGVGIRFSPDGTWNALTVGATGSLVPLDTGFEGYGTWTISDNLQFNLLSVNLGAYYFPAFTDTGWLLFDPGALPTHYVRIPTGG
jgi:hypothetical protein